MITCQVCANKYFLFGSSALEEWLYSGPLRGRPYGGTAFLIKKSLTAITRTLLTAERYCIVSAADWLLVNVYMPSSGVKNRNDTYTDILQELDNTLQLYLNRNCLIGGDFNTNLDTQDYTSHAVNEFTVRNNLHRVDMLVFEARYTLQDINRRLSRVMWSISFSVTPSLDIQVMRWVRHAAVPPARPETSAGARRKFDTDALLRSPEAATQFSVAVSNSHFRTNSSMA